MAIALPNSLWQPPFGTVVVYDNATSQWVELPSAGSIPGTVNLQSDFGASGSANEYHGTITLGSPHSLTLTTTSDFQVGQGINIAGAGPLGVDLITTVAGVASGGQVIGLTDAAATAVSNALILHDDSVSFQNSINAQFAAGGGTVMIPAGTYWLNGAFTDINSLIKIPYNTNFPSGNATVPISLVALNQGFPAFSGPPQTQAAAIFKTNKIGANANSSMIAAALWDPSSSVATPSNVTVYMQGLYWRTYSNPQISAVDMGMAGNALFNNVTIDANLNLQSIVEPTHGTFGLRSPRVNCGITANEFNQVFVINYGIGIIFAEQFRSTWFSVMGCKIGMQCEFSYHPAQGIGLIWHCQKWIVFNNRQSVDFSLDVEVEQAGHWNSPVMGQDFVDAGNLATGTIKYARIEGGTGTPSVASNTGMANVSFVNLNALDNRIAGPIAFDTLSVTDLAISGALTIAGEAVSFGANNSAAAAGFREVQVPNTGSGERFTLWAGGAGIEAPLGGSLTTGLRSFWNCNDATGAGAVDSQGVNNLGDIGTCTSVAGHVPPSSLAIGFSGSSQYETITNGAQTGLSPGNNSFTISAWFFLTDLLANRYLISKGDSTGSQDEYILSYDQPSGQFVFVIHGASYHQVNAASFGAIPATTWTFVVAWFDSGANTINIQINNGPVDSASAGGDSPLMGSGNFFMGSYDSILFWKGRIDAVGFWNRLLTA